MGQNEELPMLIPDTQPPDATKSEQPLRTYKIGDKIGGRYLVDDHLTGGIGEVYVCRDLGTYMRYALKTFKRHYLTTYPDIRQHFDAEVNRWVDLGKHSNIVQCYYLATVDNRPFMFLELVDDPDRKKTDLRHYIQKQSPHDLRLDLRSALDFMIDICRGLSYTHKHGVIHLDLKPDNILITRDKRAKITDFGLAKLIHQASATFANDESSLTVTGQKGRPLGTPEYMAPEQWRNESIDNRTDIYALGCILYEILMGSLPFKADNRAELRRLHEQMPPPDLPAEFPPRVNQVIQTCLQKEPTKRFASVDELLHELTEIYQLQFGESPQNVELAQEDAELSLLESVEYSGRGGTYLQLRRYKEALANLDHAIQLRNNSEDQEFHIKLFGELPKSDAKLYNNRGLVYLALQRYDEALSDFTRAIEIFPRFALAYRNRGDTYRSLKSYGPSMTDYTQAIQLEPSNSDGYLHRGALYAELYQYKEAIADFTQALQLDPNNAHAYLARSTILFDMQHYDEAMADHAKAIKLNPDIAVDSDDRFSTELERPPVDDPNDAEYCFRLGLLESVGERYDEALSSFTRAISLDPNISLAYLYRGNTYYNLQQYENALADLTTFIQLNHPSDYQRASAYHKRGLVNESLKRYDEALTDFQEAARLGDSEAGNAVGRVATQRFESAWEAFAKANSLVEMRVAISQLPFIGEPDFVTAAEKAVEERVQPDQKAEFEERLAWLRRIQTVETRALAVKSTDHSETDRDFQRHEEMIREAIRLDPSNAKNYQAMGLLFAHKRSLGEALPYFEKAAQLGDEEEAEFAVFFRNQLLFEVFGKVDSFGAMEQAIADFPHMSDPDFIAFVEQSIITETPVEIRSYCEERLAWLREIAATQQTNKSSASNLTDTTKVDTIYTAEHYSISGKTWYNMDRYEEALSCFTEAIRLAPNYAQAYEARGAIYAILQMYSEALADFTQVIQLDPGNAIAYYNRGGVHLALRCYEEALSDLTQAISLSPNLVEAYTDRGTTYGALKRYQEALSDFIQAINLDPNNARTYLNFGGMLYNMYAFQEALPYFEKAAELGLSQGAEYAAEIRQTLTEAAFKAFIKASSYSDMLEAVGYLPFMTSAGFIATIKQLVAQEVTLEDRSYVEERLEWLRQIATEQSSD